MLTRLDEVLAGSGSDVREAHEDTVPQDPGGDEVLGGGGAGQREDGHHSLQTVPLAGRGAHHLPALHQVPPGCKKMKARGNYQHPPSIKLCDIDDLD